MATSPNRKPARKHFASLLQTALVGVGKPCQAVYDHLTFDFEGLNPVAVVLSGPTERRARGLGEPCSDVLMTLKVYIFVVAITKDTTTGATWTASDSEDRLDDVEAEIADVVRDNQMSAYWGSVTYSEPTMPASDQVVGGQYYRQETITLQFRKLG